MTGIISWEINEHADGYVIDKQMNDEWCHIVTISNRGITQIKLVELDYLEKHVYRIRSFIYGPDGEVSILDEAPIVGEVPLVYDTKIEGLRIGGRIKDVIRLNWKPAEEATGYIIERKVDSEWKRVIKLEQPGANTYRVTGLSPDTAYSFRIAGYVEGTGISETGPYSEITGSTTK